MYSALILLLAVATPAFGNVLVTRLLPRIPMPDGRIVGGEPASIGQFPYQVSVRLFGSHICGGSILNENVIVTAAHCIYSIGASSYSVRAGSNQVSSGGQVVTAKALLKHPKYDSNVIDYDVALIFLSSSLSLSSTVRPVPLATAAPAAGSKAVVSGWGTTTENGASASALQKVEVFIVSSEQCGRQYAGVNDITDRMLCAGVSGGGKDACQGDSGGPLVSGGKLVGVVSWGVGCARQDYAGVYSNVANLRSWIEENTV